MQNNSEVIQSRLDTVKLVLALLVLVSGIAGFYYFYDKSLVLRVLGVLLAMILGGGLVLMTQIGGRFLLFLKDARVEVRKVVWPTRQETMQSTLVVVAMVFIVGLMLWMLDAGLFWGVSLLTGQGK